METKDATPEGVASSEGLGPNAQREGVADALMIVESYGPWGADLNDAHRRQIVLADEVLRLRRLYEMAVRGRAEMRTALREANTVLQENKRRINAEPGSPVDKTIRATAKLVDLGA